MDKRLKDSVPKDRTTCEICGLDGVSESTVRQQFEYGEHPNSTLLSADVPVFTCTECDSQYMDERAEKARHDAACVHLGRLTSVEVMEIRVKRRMTRDSFSEITGLGAASLARWETGKSVQSPANDKYLRLLTVNSNIRILRLGLGPAKEPIAAQPRFSHVKITPDLEARAGQFRLIA